VAEGVGKRVQTLLRGLVRSPSIRSALVFALGGVAFSFSMLLLARFLPVEQFGILALLLALIQIGLALGPAGMDLLINREKLTPSSGLARSVALTSLLAATLIAVIAAAAYDVPSALLPALWAGVTAAALSRVAGAFFQSLRRFNTAFALTQVHNFILLATVPVAMFLQATPLEKILWIVSGGYIVTALLGWGMARRQFRGVSPAGSVVWRDGIHGMGIIFAVLVLAQLERILIPLLLSLDEMAKFGVLAAVVIAPFRMLQLAVGYTLLPRLRAAGTMAESKRILRSEIRTVLLVGFVGAALVFGLGPVVVQVIVGDKYQLSAALYIVAIAVGWVRLLQSLAVATVNSLGNARSLEMLNRVAWVSLAIAAAAAWLLRELGLIGVVLGVGVGWMVQAIAGYVLARRTLATFFNTQRAGA
jgi:O-antigen/teichoic acid export membrane protein